MIGKMNSYHNIKVMPQNVLADLPETYKLSQEELKFYDVNGYFVIRKLIGNYSLNIYRDRFIQICKGIVEKGNITVVKEPALVKRGLTGEDAINKLQDILFDDVFSQYTENPRLLNTVSQLVGDEITAAHSMFINKPPGSGRHPSHQDLYYFPFRPADKIVAAWTAIDNVTIENGCLYVVPGSHKLDTLYAHGNMQDSNKLYHGILQEEAVAPLDKRVNLVMDPGDTVFFHPLLVHGSGPNVSKGYRKSITCHYASSLCRYIDVAGTRQAAVAAEVEREARRRGFDLTFQDVWRYRSKQVRGTRSNL